MDSVTKPAAADVYISCKEAARLMCFQRDRSLDTQEDGELKKHLLVCLNCRNFDRQLDVLTTLAQRYAAGGSPTVVDKNPDSNEASTNPPT